jgi:hypothetical protein
LHNVIGTWDLSPFFIPEQPIDLYAQHNRESLEFVVKYMTAIGFDLANCRPINLNPESSESSGKGILGECGLTTSSRFSHTPANNVFPRGLLHHEERLPSV